MYIMIKIEDKKGNEIIINMVMKEEISNNIYSKETKPIDDSNYIIDANGIICKNGYLTYNQIKIYKYKIIEGKLYNINTIYSHDKTRDEMLEETLKNMKETFKSAFTPNRGKLFKLYKEKINNDEFDDKQKEIIQKIVGLSNETILKQKKKRVSKKDSSDKVQ